MNADALYTAMVARDRRFDGRFFVGVTTTGVYCRPVCSARTPRRDRCHFFRAAAEAEKAGFRACFRCRPELAPGAAPIDRVSQLVAAAVTRVESGALDGESIDALAASLGVGARHLRRAMQRELGVSPIELAQSTRLAVAKRLVRDGALPITEVAYASGFSSLRRFHAAFRSVVGRTPTELRKKAPADASSAIAVRVGYREPFDFAALLAFLGARAISGVERVDGAGYARTARIGDQHGWLSVQHQPLARAVRVEVSPSLATQLIPVVGAVKRLFDLDADSVAIGAHLARYSALRARVRRRPGLRVPGAFDAFELMVRALLGQQISVAAARTLAGRFVVCFGEPVADPLPGLTHFTPTAERIAAASPSEIAAIGLPAARARALHGLAVAFARGDIRVGPGDDPDAAAAALESLPGIGPWTASYVLMRALHTPDAFPDGDLGLRRAFSPPLSPPALRARAERWRPWRAYAALYLWSE